MNVAATGTNVYVGRKESCEQNWNEQLQVQTLWISQDHRWVAERKRKWEDRYDKARLKLSWIIRNECAVDHMLRVMYS